MDASTVHNLMALIPQRVARVQTGTPFTAADSQCRYPERLAHIARFLHWMSPLEALTREDQQAFGLLNAAGRPMHAADLEDEEPDPELAEEAARPAEPLPAEDPLAVEEAIA